MTTRCPCGGDLVAVGPVGFCEDCHGMTDLASGLYHKATEVPRELLTTPAVTIELGDDFATRPEFDTLAVARRYMAASRAHAARFGVEFATADGLPPLYEDLPDGQRGLLVAALQEALDPAT